MQDIDNLIQFTGETWHGLDVIQVEPVSDVYVKNLRFMQAVKNLYEEIELEYFVYEEVPGLGNIKIHKTRKAMVKKIY